jgi:hypothetical protein
MEQSKWKIPKQMPNNTQSISISNSRVCRRTSSNGVIDALSDLGRAEIFYAPSASGVREWSSLKSPPWLTRSIIDGLVAGS